MNSTILENIQNIFDKQHENQFKIARTTSLERNKKLKRLQKALEVTFRQDIREALYADLGKHPSEVDLVEVYAIIREIKHTRNHLKKWMAKKKVSTPLALIGSSSYIHYEPKGVCLIIAPWNFPLLLALGPLVSAIAAGNTIIIKPSEKTPHTSAVINKIINYLFIEEEVAVIEGAVEVSTKLLELPFNHIFFTGSPQIGKIVMKAAANHLTSVTLELGGKSPVFIDKTADIKVAAKRIAWGKLLNAGQICIAPDYVLVHESIIDEFIETIKIHIKSFFTANAEKSESYARIVNEDHFSRLVNYLNDAVEKGANIVYGGNSNAETNYIEPTLVKNVSYDSKLLTEEIFGPILPIIPYKDLDEAIQYVSKGEKPLALYIYSKNNKNIQHIINTTRAGGSCINNNAVHYFNNNLPFGGSNNSGIGKAHGFYGFESFSNARAVYNQHISGALELLMPPYDNFKQKLIDLTIKWF